MHARDWLLAFLALIFPPIPVIFKRGLCTVEFLISIILLIFGFLPSVIYSWYIISKYPTVEHILIVDCDGHNHDGYGAV
ncbi:uncharacterized protein SAPINGB_P001507 [Magnusiomyces paraingens]|uniref:Uncharacterized protein n=1 Tax=Magnusiomyces paraingens TaxID=2606893 RepID=A0A5E8B629_9ASCO|nr:uncharacterized protein SAPINGB_P001507 [Saprochaete ingens]VVT47027.1 unnamed protein product [Saprochaete ingens]